MKRYFLFIYFVALNALTLPPTCSSIQIVSFLHRKFGVLTHTASRIATLWARIFFGAMPGWHVKILSLENLISPTDTVIFVANHQSLTDVFMMYLLRRRLCFVTKEAIFKIPMIGATTAALGNVRLKRGNRSSAEAAMEQCEKLLKDNVSVFLYPEGTRSKTGELLPFKSGAFRLAKKLNIPLQPIAVMGARDLLEKGSLIPKPFYAAIKVLPLIYPGEHSVDALTEITRRAIVDALADTPAYMPSA